MIVGAETGGIPLASAVSLIGSLPFAFVRKPGYTGHENHEPQVRGAEVADRRVLLVDDAVSSGSAIEAFSGQLRREGASVVGVFCLVDIRDVAGSVTQAARSLPIESITTYGDVLAAAAELGVLDPAVRHAIDALTNRWSDDDPRWTLLAQQTGHPTAASRRSEILERTGRSRSASNEEEAADDETGLILVTGAGAARGGVGVGNKVVALLATRPARSGDGASRQRACR